MEKVREHRVAKLQEALKHAQSVAKCISGKLPNSAVIMIGSYARGDFNKWSDIDLLVVTSSELPPNPLRRLEVIQECITTNMPIEPVVLTVDELMKRLRKKDPLAVEAVKHGLILYDVIGFRKRIQSGYK